MVMKIDYSAIIDTSDYHVLLTQNKKGYDFYWISEIYDITPAIHVVINLIS